MCSTNALLVVYGSIKKGAGDNNKSTEQDEPNVVVGIYTFIVLRCTPSESNISAPPHLLTWASRHRLLLRHSLSPVMVIVPYTSLSDDDSISIERSYP